MNNKMIVFWLAYVCMIIYGQGDVETRLNKVDRRGRKEDP